MGEKRSRQTFSIDDAFEEEHTDAIRVYGATTTTERSPLRPPSSSSGRVSLPSSMSVAGADAVSVHIHDPPTSLSVKPIIRGLTKLKGGDDSVSKDSDSLITEELESSYDPAMPWFYHPKVRENWKMVLAAFFLLVIGLGLTIGGIVIVSLPINGIQGAVFIFAGIICLTPGAYHLFYIYCAVKGKRGYDFYHLPLFN
ncbi:transmembrane protein 134 [Folsomia candida]|uniref:Transmembrane protein 134 n=1 Tax=Folsomia candida TaxID=158441 RepID=A0A226DES3_FOLCA|nr:transmembrane protein 134 [Folsomia candida]XP_021962437.1 transmembrane protein 134 [Folsomia candida]XP_021962438.1 transmembrane protein 134 [Folsomia candida]XP_021962440.1 transmembrane protein 134 [Folsomia candida]OXA44075.1 hypothetical protein Fcan01_21082 [Folsomia candida]